VDIQNDGMADPNWHRVISLIRHSVLPVRHATNHIMFFSHLILYCQVNISTEWYCLVNKQPMSIIRWQLSAVSPAVCSHPC